MAKQRKRKPKSADELNTENEFLKMKMMAEFGGEFIGNSDIPPEVENAFLKQIEKIQRAHAEAVMIPLYEFVGKPEYSHVHDLGDKELQREYKRLLKVLNKHGIDLTTVSNAPVGELYRFLTEELFKREVESIRLKGWKLHFVYEDFYPNHEFDVKRVAHDAMLMLIDKGQPPYEAVFDEDMRDKLGFQIDFEEWLSNLRYWQSTFRQARIEDIKLIALHLNDEKNEARLVCEVDYGIQAAKFKKYTLYTYTLEFWIAKKPETGWWLVNRIDFEEL